VRFNAVGFTPGGVFFLRGELGAGGLGSDSLDADSGPEWLQYEMTIRPGEFWAPITRPEGTMLSQLTDYTDRVKRAELPASEESEYPASAVGRRDGCIRD